MASRGQSHAPDCGAESRSAGFRPAQPTAPMYPWAHQSPPLPPPPLLRHLHKHSLNFCGDCPGYHGHPWPITCPQSWGRLTECRVPPQLAAIPPAPLPYGPFAHHPLNLLPAVLGGGPAPSSTAPFPVASPSPCNARGGLRLSMCGITCPGETRGLAVPVVAAQGERPLGDSFYPVA